MTARRTVKLALTPSEVPTRHVDHAVGYLAGWSLHGGRFTSVHISGGGPDGYMEAVYRMENDEIGYVIGAVWRPKADGDEYPDGRYTFHS